MAVADLNQDINFIQLNESEVLCGLCKLNIRKRASADSLNPIFLNKCAAFLCKPIAMLFNIFFRIGKFPDK